MQTSIIQYFKIIFLALLALAYVACENTSEAGTEFTGTKWLLVKMNGEEILKTDNSKPVFIQFQSDENKVNGFAGCNSYFGSYELSESTITFSPIGATRMMCPEMEIEDLFFQILGKVNELEIKGHILVLKTPQGQTLAFSAK